MQAGPVISQGNDPNASPMFSQTASRSGAPGARSEPGRKPEQAGHRLEVANLANLQSRLCGLEAAGRPRDQRDSEIRETRRVKT